MQLNYFLQAGLSRTLRSTRCGGSETDEDFGTSQQSFFPRCFDLSDFSQLDEFKDSFRQTAAEVVLKVCEVSNVNVVTTRHNI